MSLGVEITSCGVYIEDSVSRQIPEELVKSWCLYHANWPSEDFAPVEAAFIIFSDNTNTFPGHQTSAGRRLANYIRHHKLGTVTVTRPRMNPNSGNDIQVFTYAVDNAALRRWFNALP